MSQNNKYLRKILNNSQNYSKTEGNYRMYKTKTEILPFNSSYNQNNKVYMKFEPENLKRKYKMVESKPILYKNKAKLSEITNNSLNNSTNGKIFKKSFFLNNSKNNSLLNSKSKDKSFGEIYVNKNSKVDLNKEKSKGLSPIKKYIENNKIYINKGIKNSKKKEVQNAPYNNHTLEYKIVNNAYIINSTQNLNNNNYKINQRTKNNSKPSLNIYQIKMTNIFVQIINRNIFKHIKKDIIIFFDNLKDYNYNFYHNRKKLNEPSDYKYKKNDSKYNQYKDLIYSYFKTNNNLPGIIYKNLYKNEDELMSSLKNKKTSQVQNNDSKNKNSNNNKNDKIRFRELQKKYENIYQRKKNYNISFDDRYKKYLENSENNLYDPKKGFDYNKLKDSQNKNNANNERMMFKRKILINQLYKNGTKTKTNLSQDFNRSSKFKNQIIYNSYSNSPKNSILLNPYHEESQNNKNGVIIKKLKITPKLSSNLKRKNSNSIEKKYENKISREVFKVYNVKNIVTKDKRLYVHMNYISLYNDKKFYHENKNNYYNDNLLKISDKIIISFNYNRLIDVLKSNKRHEKLSNIIEEKENSVKNNNSSNENDNEDNTNEKEKSEENTHILQNDVVKNIVLDFNKDNETNINIDDNYNIELNKLKIYGKENKRYLNSNDKDEDNKKNDGFENSNKTNNSSNEGIKFDIQRNNMENFVFILRTSLIDYVMENKKE